jgi:metal-responsive CopG/Arc/MetJ family transcriptional regulator
MEKLIPYSIHLRPDIYEKIKAAAGERKASELIRNAITMYLEEEEPYEAGYKAGFRMAIEEVKNIPLLNHIRWQEESMADMTARILEESYEA